VKLKASRVKARTRNVNVRKPSDKTAVPETFENGRRTQQLSGRPDYMIDVSFHDKNIQSLTKRIKTFHRSKLSLPNATFKKVDHCKTLNP